MFKTGTKEERIMKLVCLLLMIVIFVLQFTPFWNFDGKGVSINGYVWFPHDHADLETYLKSNIDGFTVNQVVLMPVIQLVACVVGIILFMAQGSNPLVALVSLVCSIGGIWGFLAEPAFRLGTNWVLQLVLNILMLLSSVAVLVLGLKDLKSEK